MADKIATIDAGYHEAPPELVTRVRKCIVPLFTVQDGELKSIGSGTMISSWGAILTAGHVLEAAIRAGLPRARDGRRYQEYTLYAMVRTGQFHPGSRTDEIGGLVPVTNIWIAEDLDVAFCALGAMINKETGQQLEYDHIPINLEPPALGQRCFAMGFPVADGTSTDGITIDYTEKLYTTDGEITEIYPVGRDSSSLPYPCFTVEGNFEHKMSGGPVFLDGGMGIAGIITRGVDETRAYASMVWTGLGIQTDLVGDHPKTLAEAVQRDFVAAVKNGYTVQLQREAAEEATYVKLIKPSGSTKAADGPEVGVRDYKIRFAARAQSQNL